MRNLRAYQVGIGVCRGAEGLVTVKGKNKAHSCDLAVTLDGCDLSAQLHIRRILVPFVSAWASRQFSSEVDRSPELQKFGGFFFTHIAYLEMT